MRKPFFIFCVVFAFCGAIAIQAQNRVMNYEDRNAIPAWVEKVTTPDEYAIWKTLSRYYRVDYSYAKYQRQATDGERKEVYERLKTLCERLESGELKVAPNETFAVVPTERGVLNPLSSCPVACQEKRFLLYTDAEGYDAHLMLKLVYVYDEAANAVKILKKEVCTKSFSGLSISMDDVTEKLELDYFPELGMFKGYCYAMMAVTTPEGETHFDQVNVNFQIEP